MTTMSPDQHRYHSADVPIRLLTAAEIDAGRNHPIGTPEERAREVAEILSRSTFTVPPRRLPRPAWYR
jgi:hypothetical protein